ncbi:LacI family DNA-binding transcriptional regulator [uncultured Clostridium sp.]|uniref:LacI family DNA-binding transcriptional regulator n=1 Tax=Clostridium sp. TaxID=1506 RepID=UPI0025F6078A|nr:LacI family DNA-binding transcriptional regulator [uncultured Clostridium sp.]
MALNIIDIAKLAGVSKSTVSRYLNNGYVSVEARDKIKRVLDETGFTPQRQAKGMRTKKTNLIGVIVPKISSETPARVVEGITEVLSCNGYDILIANTNLSIEKELEYLNIFKSNQVDGIIFMATKVTDKHIEVIKNLEVPIVVVAQDIENSPSVYFDEFQATEDITNYLIKKGHEKIAYIGVYEEDKAVGLYRKQAYIKTLKNNNIKINYENIKIGDFNEKSGYRLAKEIMEGEDNPTAIVAVTDNLALGAIEYLIDNGYKIPEDIAVVGMGDSKISRVITPKLTTVHYHYKTAGRKSAEIILDELDRSIEKDKSMIKKVKLNCLLVERNSV